MRKFAYYWILFSAIYINTGSLVFSSEFLNKPILAARNANCVAGFIKNSKLPSEIKSSPYAMLLGAMILMSIGSQPLPDGLLSLQVMDDLKLFANEDTQDLEDDVTISEDGLERILIKLRLAVGPTVYESVVGNVLASGTRSAQVLTLPTYPEEKEVSDLMDMRRHWGWKLLPEHDPAFMDSRYLVKMANAQGQSGLFFEMTDEISGFAKSVYENWIREIHENSSPAVDPYAFYLTGSDANNGLFDLANSIVERFELVTKKENPRKVHNADILAFEGVYAAERGPMKLKNFNRIKVYGKGDTMIPSAHFSEGDLQDQTKREEILKRENMALDFIKNRVLESRKESSLSRPIGGVLIEAILGASGVYVYSQSFMKRLRLLCDELQIAIFADEILTGGGRTGKFFAYQHYEGFEPDFITFGKGLQLSGILSVKRFPDSRYKPTKTPEVTLTQYLEPLLKSIQVMQRIRNSGLMKNAQVLGPYFHRKLEEYFKISYPSIDVEVRSKGLLIYAGKGSSLLKQDLDWRLRDASGRLMPYLSITKDEIDELFESLKK